MEKKPNNVSFVYPLTKKKNPTHSPTSTNSIKSDMNFVHPSVPEMEEEMKMTPSELFKNLTTVEKKKPKKYIPPKIIEFMNLEDHTNQTTTDVPIDQPLFQPNPAKIVFYDYKPFGNHQTKLLLRNNDTVARRVRIQKPDSPYFQVSGPKTTGKNKLKDGKVAAGMEVCYVVSFTPQNTREYKLDLICCTEREKFIVPVYARGNFSLLSLPNDIDFSVCPVKTMTSKVTMAHNIGTKAANFLFSSSSPFKVIPANAYVDIGKPLQIEIQFYPLETKQYSGELVVEDDSGKQSYVQLMGTARNVNLYLSQPIIEPDPAYISLSSRKSIKIYNCSDQPVNFVWRAFSDTNEELNERNRLYEELSKVEEIEMKHLEDQKFPNNDSDDSLSDDDGISSAKRHEIISLRRKYKNLRKAVRDDQMQFADDCFVLEPQSGQIWANSEIEITATFRPQMAAAYACAAYLDVSGRDSRLLLQLHGQGIGPKAVLSYDVLDIGDVFINSVHKYEIFIENKGDISAEYELDQGYSAFSSNFKFFPSNGVLDVNETQKLDVTFCSEILGEFSEHFYFMLTGSEEPLKVHFKGHVIGPTFHFNESRFDFGIISYGFLLSKAVNLINTSEIPMKYKLRIPQDGKYQHKEFIIMPDSGTILPNDKQKILIEFTSINVKVYEYCLVVDVEGVGEDLLSLPISAECQVPKVTLLNSEIQFGKCYLRYPHVEKIVLVNKSDILKAKFEAIPQDEQSCVVASYNDEVCRGSIGPGESTTIELTLVCKKLGSIRLPMQIRIAGSTDLPLTLTLVAHGNGPIISLKKRELNWGGVTCLKDHEKILSISNTSLVPAPFKTFIRNARSKFKINVKEAVLAPGEDLELQMVANLDDTIVFRDQLHILVTEGDNLVVQLTAKGTGTTMWCEKSMKVIDFEYQQTSHECEWEFTLENKGRRSQTLTWINTAEKLIEMEQQHLQEKGGTDAVKLSKSPNAPSSDILPECVFSVHPASIELKPRTACNFIFKGLTTNPGIVQEVLVCQTKVGQEKKPKVAFSTEVQAHFINPKLKPSLTSISFSYVYSPASEMITQSCPLSLTNTTQLPISFVLRTQVPFSVDMWEASLKPSESIDLNVEFHPSYKDDRISRSISGKLVASYSNHPQKDSIDLFGEIFFPNLEFEYTRIDFGCILNDTQKSLVVKVTNTSKVDTSFRWIFVEDEDDHKSGVSSKKSSHIPINQVFDILPIRSYLQPGETEHVEFIYYGHASRKFKCIAACEVDGGPEYELSLLGEASSVCYRLDKPFIDFGPVLFDKTEDREFCIINSGKVAFSFSIVLSGLANDACVVDVTPLTGRIFANDRQRITVRYTPGIPDYLRETLTLNVAHFEPFQFNLYGQGIFASLSLNLPKEIYHTSTINNQLPKWSLCLREAKRNLENPREDIIAPTVHGGCETRILGASSRTNSRTPGQSTDRGGGNMTTRLTSRTGRTTSRTNQSGNSSRSTGRTGVEKLGTIANRSTAITEEEEEELDSASIAPPLSQPVELTPEMIDIEASRMFYIKYLQAKQNEPETPGVSTAISAVKIPRLTLTPSAMTAVSKESRVKVKTPTIPAPPLTFVIAQYILDFGNVISGTHKQKKFKLTNTGLLPISFRLDKNYALNMGFSIEPERVVRLPEKESINFVICFQTRKNTRYGKVQADLSIEMKNGPTCMLSLKANVTVPDVILSSDSLEFNEVLVGRSQIIFTQLHNTTPISADWSLKAPIGSTKDASYFLIDPRSGLLQPGAKCNLKVEFIPREKRTYQITFPIKIASNPKPRLLMCRGDGAELRLSFEPSIAEMGPVLPCALSKPISILMKNEGDYEIEVYSLDFDKQYIEEETILREATGFGIVDDVMRTSIREPGQGLAAHILEEHNQRIEESKRHQDNENTEEDESPPTTIDIEEINKPSHEPVLIEPACTNRSKGEAKDYIVIGPPCCGISSQSKAISSRLNVSVWTIDEAIDWAVGQHKSTLGKQTRHALGLPEHVEEVAEDGDESEVKIHIDEDQITETGNNNEEEGVAGNICSGLSVQLLTQVFSSFLSETCFDNGGVLDSLDSTYISFESVVEALSNTFSNVIIVVISLSELVYEKQLNVVVKCLKESLTTLEAQLSDIPASIICSVKENDQLENIDDRISSLEINLKDETAVDNEITAPVLDDVDTGEDEIIKNSTLIDSLSKDLEEKSACLKRVEEALKLDLFENYTDSFADLMEVLQLYFVEKHLIAEEDSVCISEIEEKDSSLDSQNIADEESLDDQVAVPTEEKKTVNPEINEKKCISHIIEVNLATSHNIDGVSSLVYTTIERYFRDFAASTLKLPESVTYQLLRRPVHRLPRKLIKNFTICKYDDDTEELVEPCFRWRIRPHSSCTLQINFESTEVGSFDSAMGFEIVGGSREYSLWCRGICAVPTINSDPRNVFMNRIKSRSDRIQVQKKYVVTKGCYEFGPILIGKSPDIRLEKSSTESETITMYHHAKEYNSEMFRVSNNGRFDAHVNFSFLSSSDGASVFYVEPIESDLAEGDTVEVIVWAFPVEAGIHKDSLVCCISDNPEPILFPVSCFGAVPSIHITGPWDKIENAEIDCQAKDCLVDFDRLLLHRNEKKSFNIKNTSLIPIAWKLMNIESLPANFEITPAVDGQLKPDEIITIIISFNSEVEGEYDFLLNVSYSDSEGGICSAGNEIVPIRIKAEAYKIDVCSFENTDGTNMDGILDFGLMRVNENARKIFKLRNRGKYEIKFRFFLCRTATKHLFTVEPMEAIIQPSETMDIQVDFNSHQEVSLHHSKDIRCLILENATDEVFTEFSVLTNVRSVHSKYRLQPFKGINFGPLRFNEELKVKEMEVRNDGEFEFKYRITTEEYYNNNDQLTLDTDVSKMACLTIGQFSVDPCGGTIDPGSLKTVQIKFQPKESALYQEKIFFEISGRDMNDNKDAGLVYELTGESCCPGIDCSNFDCIFEEQAVVRSLDTGIGNGKKRVSNQNKVYSMQERVFTFGAIICSSSNPKGVVERFKIRNPTKVHANVKFYMKPDENLKQESSSSDAFIVQPQSWDIPPHEHRYVSVYFKPTSIRKYSAVFQARVDDGVDPSTNILEFGLRGEGTMPCITIEHPVLRTEDGALLLDFGRIQANKKKELPLILRNDGIVSATVLFSMPFSPFFTFSGGRNGSFVLPCNSSETFSVQFNPNMPTTEATECCILKMNVQHNPYEETSVKMIGKAYQEFLTFEDLPNGSDDELNFGDIDFLAIQSSPSTSFTIRNQTSSALVFDWTDHPAFQFSPHHGHLLPKATKSVFATFQVKEAATEFCKIPVEVAVQKIKHDDGEDVVDWDDTMKVVSFDDTENSGSQKKTITEPKHELVGELEKIVLKCSGVADISDFGCNIRNIAFKKTFMFQSCVYKLEVRNPAKISLKYTWAIQNNGLKQDNNIIPCPFSVFPESGEILPEDAQSFLVRFSPSEVDDFSYSMSFDLSTSLKKEPLVIELSGRSMRPVCHVDLEHSDYLQRRTPGLVGPDGELGSLSVAVRVIEMESLGIRVRNTRRFYIVNPTSTSYEFDWQPTGIISSAFRCCTPKGLMLAGKRCEMVFEFTPQVLDLQESFWRFKIPQFQIDQLFLIVGTTTEPRIMLDRGNVNFNTLLVGSRANQVVYLINDEHIPFNFAFDKVSIERGEKSVISIHPFSGVIPPNGRCAVEVQFSPNEEKDYNFNLVCIVKRKPTRLSLNIKGEGYVIHDCLTISDEHVLNNKQLVVLNQPNHIDFGTVRVNEKSIKHITISNTGKFNFEYSWEYEWKNPMITLNPTSGTIRKSEKIVCELSFSPTKEVHVDGLQLVCTTAGSQNYFFTLSGHATPPAVTFSFTSYDFGACYIVEPDADPLTETVLLRIANQDPEMDISLDCTYEKRLFLQIKCPPTVLGPNEAVEIPVTFTPRQEVVYNEVIPFMINGSMTYNIQIQGEGIVSRIELANLSVNQHINFGALQIGQVATQTIKILNRAKRSALINLTDDLFQMKHVLESKRVSFFPDQDIIIRARDHASIELRFSPLERIPFFKENLYVVAAGTKRTLLTISGSCQGMDVSLETNTLSFGSVWEGSHLSRKIRIQNRGDLVAKFRWNLEDFGPNFAISPLEGILPPSQDKVLEVLFQPQKISDEICLENIPCLIEGSDILTLTLQGSCGPQPDSKVMELKFETKVRQEKSSPIIIANPTSIPWNLIPVIEGEYWKSDENLAVPALGKAEINIIYYPLTMTLDENENSSLHEGSIFFALPDGTGIKYNLFGKSNMPDAIERLELACPAKKNLPINLPVKNWLNSPQLFEVTIDILDQNESIFVNGTETIRVPPATARNYNIKFYSYKIGSSEFKVTFTNKATSEYLFYDIQVNCSDSEVIETIHFEAPVRQSVKKIVTIENPFPKETELHFAEGNKWWQCSNKNVQVHRLSELSGRTEGSFEIEFRPLVHQNEPQREELSISCAELGDYKYILLLSTSPAGVEKILYFTAPLGSSQVENFRFTSYSKSSVDFKCSLNQSTFFEVANSIKSIGTDKWEGEVIVLPIKFEPEALGEIRDTLLITSTEGEYKCSLQGQATSPLPHGPFIFSTSQEINFKNVFNEQKEFLITVDNPRFTANVKNMAIPGKAMKSIIIKVDSAIKSGSNVGKLLVSCPSLPDMPPWVYYLETEKTIE